MSDKSDKDQEKKVQPSPSPLDLPEDLLAELRAATVKGEVSKHEQGLDVSRGELGGLPTQDPPRRRLKL